MVMSTPLATFTARTVDGRSMRSWYAERRPPAAAGDLLSCTWHGAPGWPRALRLMPDGCVDVSWDGREVWVTPARAVPTAVTLGEQGVTAGIRLQPHAAVAVFGRPVPRLDVATQLGELWPEPVVETLIVALTRGAGPVTPDEAVALLADAVRERSCELSHRPDPAVAEVVRRLDEPGATVAGVAGSVGLSERTMRRRLVGDLGLAPKEVQEVLRFRRALDAVGSADLATIAVTAGYYDQAHLTRWFGRLAQTTPAKVAARRHPSEG